jgi:hypothetical protein
LKNKIEKKTISIKVTDINEVYVIYLFLCDVNPPPMFSFINFLKLYLNVGNTIEYCILLFFGVILPILCAQKSLSSLFISQHVCIVVFNTTEAIKFTVMHE